MKSRRNDARYPGNVTIHYPLHPCYRRKLPVARRFGTGDALQFELQADDRRVLVPAWMTDADRCRQLTADGDFRTSMIALLEATDATYTSVRQHLASEWEQAIAARQGEESRLASFDDQSPVLPTAEQQQELDRLGEEVDRIWHHPRASMSLKKQIVQLLIEESVIEFDQERDELVCQVHWSGGHHTELVEPRRRRNQKLRTDNLAATVEVLRKVMSDKVLAATLNRAKDPRSVRQDVERR